MQATYSATLTNGRRDWVGASPALPPNQAVPVEVTVQVEPVKAADGAAMVAALEAIAARGGLGIDDPVAWQREVRKDRPLLGRDE